MFKHNSRRLAVAMGTMLATIGSWQTLASAEEVAVVQIYDPAIVNTIPFVGCDGAPVTTTFTGWLRATMVIHPDGTVIFRLKTQEVATWQQDGVDYTAAVNFSLSESTRVGDITTAVTNGIGSGTDGSRVRMHDVIHVTIDRDGNLVRSFDRGAAECI